MTTTSDGFFAVGRKTFIKTCDMGINPATAFLVMACGTGRDQSTTKWSASAIAKFAGVRWSTAGDAIKALLAAGIAVLKLGGKPTKPSYKLQVEGDLIWLPRAIVEGAADEIPPVTKLRQTQDSMTLRLFIELYSAQNLVEDGGISQKVIYQKYERKKAGQQGSYVVWDFTYANTYVTWSGVTNPHRRVKFTTAEVELGKNAAVDFFPRLGRIETLGLIEWTPYLFESETGEPLHAMAENGLPAEKALYLAAVGAAESMLTDGQNEYAQGTGGLLVPVLRHIDHVQMIGVARLRYRPQTSLTAAWWVTHNDSCKAYAAAYTEILKPKTVVNDNSNRNKISDLDKQANVPF